MEEEKRKKPASFIEPRNPSIDRRFRPHPNPRVKTIDFDNISESDEESNENEESYETESDLVSNVDSYATTTASSTDQLTYSDDHSECTEGSNSAQLESAEVYLRLRPIKNTEISCSSYKICGTTLITSPINEANNSKNNLEKHFMFTDIYDDNFYQNDIYNNCVEYRILSEQNFTLMTYGTSGSGKTFTLLGSVESPGIIPRSIQHIFTLYAKNIAKTPTVGIKCGEIICLNDNQISECILKRKILLGNNFNDVKPQYDRVKCKISLDHKFSEIQNEELNYNVSIWVSFVEIYNENCYDLLSAVSGNCQKRDSLKIYSNNSNVYIKNLTSVFVKNSLEAYKLLTLGLKRLNYASTAVNLNSSRSHCIFIIDCLKSYQNCEIIRTTYKYCDLAGSERLGKTQNCGNRLKEAQRINTSLMVLGRCLDIANQNQSKRNQDIIPFRDSKLTMILKAPLLGKEKIALLVNISPTEEYYEENLNVLSFSSIAKNIKIVAKKPEKIKQRFSILSNFVNPYANEENTVLIEENISLKNEVERLQLELIEAENARVKVISEMKEDYIENTLQLKKAATKQTESLTTYYETKLQIKADQNERTKEYYQNIIKKMQKRIDSNNTTVQIIEDDDEEDYEDEDEGVDHNNEDVNQNNEDVNQNNEDVNNYLNRSQTKQNDKELELPNLQNNSLNSTVAASPDNNCFAQNSDSIKTVLQNQSLGPNSSNSFENLNKNKENNSPISEKNNLLIVNNQILENKNRSTLNIELEKHEIDSKKRRVTASPTY